MTQGIEVALWEVDGKIRRHLTTFLITVDAVPEVIVWRGRAFVLVGGLHYHAVPTHVLDV